MRGLSAARSVCWARNCGARARPSLNRLRARLVAFVFQNPTTYLNPVLTVGRQITEVFELRPELFNKGGERLTPGERRRRAWRRVVDYLGLVKIPDPERVARQYPFELSGGMQQRAVIAMALIRRPALVIADEITTALDVTVQAQILSLLRELRHSISMTLLMITHDLGVITQLADTVAVMYSGVVVECADAVTLFKHAKHPYSRALLEAVPTIRGDRTVLRPIAGVIPPLTDPPPGCRFQPRCPQALERCARVVPVATTVAAGQRVACHLYDGGPA